MQCDEYTRNEADASEPSRAEGAVRAVALGDAGRLHVYIQLLDSLLEILLECLRLLNARRSLSLERIVEAERLPLPHAERVVRQNVHLNASGNTIGLTGGRGVVWTTKPTPC